MNYQDDKNLENLKDSELSDKILNLSDEVLVARTVKLAHTERKITHWILLYVNEVERRRLYARLGYGSMFDYLVKHLKYSEGSAQRRLQSARLLLAVPEISSKIDSGDIKLTQLNRVQSMLKHQEQTLKLKISKDKKLEILKQIENKNSFETECILNEVFQVPVKHEEKMTAQADGSVILQLTISKELLEKLTECKNIFSHVKNNSSWAEVIELQSDFVIAKKSPGREVKERKIKSPGELKGNDKLENKFASAVGTVAEPEMVRQSKASHDKTERRAKIADEPKILGGPKTLARAKSELTLEDLEVCEDSVNAMPRR